ncbi:hypothetical protein EJ02DRAFT_457097 [Clathrospora elynae]|uniref:DUF7709 domain-containing protein n=1 Tax=Clathrospora elynae TaxID=706981 RepID=A0A6A5SHS8_9PLEO|nr:hypothetical protein EJ02DRAFT_457097 [Clathrospora elynae]
MPQSEDPGDKLAALNSAVMGTTMPTVILPDGQRVQTGTVGALIINIKLYDELLSQSSVDDDERRAELEAMMAASLPVLKKAGMFDLFTPEDWMRGSSPGRRFVGELAIKDGHV